MKYLSLILILVLSKYKIKGFKTSDFCIRVNDTNKCLKYDCGTKLCSINKQSCMNLITWGHIIKQYIKEEIQRIKYNKFIKSIKNCKTHPTIDSGLLFIPDNYCKKADQNIVCEVYTCGKDYCTSNKRSCENLITLESVSKTYANNNVRCGEEMKQIKILKKLIRSIKNCDLNGHVYFKNQWIHRLNFG